MGSQAGTVLASLRVHRKLAETQDIQRSLALLGHQVNQKVCRDNAADHSDRGPRLPGNAKSLRYRMLRELPGVGLKEPGYAERLAKPEKPGEKTPMLHLLERLRKVSGPLKDPRSSHHSGLPASLSYVATTNELFRIAHHRNPVFNPAILLFDDFHWMEPKSQNASVLEASTVRAVRVNFDYSAGNSNEPIPQLAKAPSGLSELPGIESAEKTDFAREIFDQLPEDTTNDRPPYPTHNEENHEQSLESENDQLTKNCNPGEKRLFVHLID